jgi:hypothetical protein
MMQNRKNIINFLLFLAAVLYNEAHLETIFCFLLKGGPRGQTVPQVVSKGISPVCDVPQQVSHA